MAKGRTLYKATYKFYMLKDKMAILELSKTGRTKEKILKEFWMLFFSSKTPA